MSTVKKAVVRQGFKTGEFVVYPSHGVGQITAIEEQEVAGFKLELFVVSFAKDKMPLRVPTAKAASVGLRKGSWEAQLWGKNLTDETYITSSLFIIQFGQYTPSLGERRTGGISVTYRY